MPKFRLDGTCNGLRLTLLSPSLIALENTIIPQEGSACIYSYHCIMPMKFDNNIIYYCEDVYGF